MIYIKSESQEIDNLLIPNFQLSEGDALCLHWPLPFNTNTEEKFIKYLSNRAKDHRLLVKAEPLVYSTNQFFSFIKRKSIKDILESTLSDDCFKRVLPICEILKINIENDFNSISFTQKMLLGVETAYCKEPDILLFSISGLDPIGISAVFDSINSKLKNTAVIYFSYPMIPKRICYPHATEHLDISVKDKGYVTT